MKSSYINSYGGLEVIEYGELPARLPHGYKHGGQARLPRWFQYSGQEPELTDDKVIVNVKAVSINPLDYKIRRGDIKFISGSKFPRVLGGDFAGIIKEVGSHVKDFKSGDSVYGFVLIHIQRFGALAEFVSIKPKHIRKIPEGMIFEDAASLPVAALTALNGLRLCGNLRGKTVLINGATGGVGHFAVQIAKAKSSIVTGVCSTRNVELAKQLGAQSVIDYTKENFISSGNQYDVIFDAYGKLKFAKASRALTQKGIFLTTLFPPSLIFKTVILRFLGGKKIFPANMRKKPEDYAEIEKLIEDGSVKPVIEQIYPLSQTKEAFTALEQGKVRGKIIIQV